MKKSRRFKFLGFLGFLGFWVLEVFSILTTTIFII